MLRQRGSGLFGPPQKTHLAQVVQEPLLANPRGNLRQGLEGTQKQRLRNYPASRQCSLLLLLPALERHSNHPVLR